MAESAGLLFKINADSSQAEREIKKFKADLKDMEKAAKDSLLPLQEMGARAGLSADQFTSIASGARIAGAGLLAVTAAVTTTAVALFQLSKSAADFGSEIFDASQKTGLGAEALSALKFAAEQSGSSFQQVTKGITVFGIALGEAGQGSDKAQDKLKSLGVTSQDLDAALGQVFKTIADAKNPTDALALATAAFGKKIGPDLIPLIKDANGNYEELIANNKELGVTMTDEAAAAADEFGDQMDVLNAQLAGVGRTIGFTMIPLFLEWSEMLSDWLVKNQTEISNWANGFARAIKFTVDSIVNNMDVFVGLAQILSSIASMDYAGAAAGVSRIASAVAAQQGAWSKLTAPPDRVQGSGRRASSGFIPGLDGESDAKAGRKGRGSSSDRDSRTDEQVYRDFVKALKEVGVPITSGKRSFAEQQKLFKQLGPGEAARPGTSDHEFWKAVDLPAGVASDLLDKAAEIAGVTLGKEIIHKGTGRHRHQPFGKATGRGGGEAATERRAIEEQKELDRLEEESAKQREKEAEFIAKLKEEYWEKEDQAYEDAYNWQRKLWDIEKARYDAAMEQSEKMGPLQTFDPSEIIDLGGPAEDAGTFEGAGSNIFDQWTVSWEGFADAVEGRIGNVQSAFGELGGIIENAFAGMANAIGSVVEQWVLYGETGPAVMRKILASALASIAAEAAVQALYASALGFIRLAQHDYAAAGQAFTSAALFAGVAAAAGLAGRAIAGDSFKQQSGAATGRGSGANGEDRREDPRAIQRESENAFLSGKVDRLVELQAQMVAEQRNHTRILAPFETASEGAIVRKGIAQNPGLVGKTAVNDIGKNSGLANQFVRNTRI